MDKKVSQLISEMTQDAATNERLDIPFMKKFGAGLHGLCYDRVTVHIRGLSLK
ncbi:MAG: hypothetical protein AAGJ12_02510 [Bacteroidota bacterium]|nr:hypothetical protein [uncultured Allomuricauda sp.]